MLPIKDRQRLAELEALLRRNDREFVDRIECIADALLPHRRGEPRPPDDIAPRSSRVSIDGRGTHPGAPPALTRQRVPALRRAAGAFARLRRSWMQILAMLCWRVWPRGTHARSGRGNG